MSEFKLLIRAVIMTTVVAGSLWAQAPQQEGNAPSAAAPAKAPVHVAAADQDKKVTKRVAPVYPKDAYDAKLTGVINLEVTIGVDGKVTNVAQRGKGDDALVKAAMDAVKQWVYKPTKDKESGMPVEVITIVSINFKVGE
jgi:protein TonB